MGQGVLALLLKVYHYLRPDLIGLRWHAPDRCQRVCAWDVMSHFMLWLGSGFCRPLEVDAYHHVPKGCAVVVRLQALVGFTRRSMQRSIWAIGGTHGTNTRQVMSSGFSKLDENYCFCGLRLPWAITTYGNKGTWTLSFGRLPKANENRSNFCQLICGG